MDIFVLFSVLVIPVFLLASPMAIFESKNRSDIATYYWLSMSAMQVVILIAYWGQLSWERAALWVIILLGISLLLGTGFVWYKSRDNRWLGYVLATVILTGSIVATVTRINP